MARYELRAVGVYDRDTGQVIKRTDLLWSDYRTWLLSNTPDPMPPEVVPPKTPEELAAEAELAARVVMRGELAADTTIQFLRTHTPAECAAWVNTNVTDLATAKSVLSKLAMVVAYLARERLAGD